MARLAAENIEAGENRQRFRRAFAALLACRAAAHSDDFLEERRRFYQVVREIGGNAELSRVMPLTHIHLFRMQFHSFQSPAGLQAQFAEYERIGQAIQDGDAAAAERYMRTHIRRSRRRLDAVPEAAFFRSDD